MKLEEPNKVDAIGVDIKTGQVVLSLFDNKDWSEEKKHLRLLEDKLNAYLNFIDSGELYKAYQDAEGRTVKIQLFALYPLPPRGIEFLEKAEEIINEKGCLFGYRIIENDHD